MNEKIKCPICNAGNVEEILRIERVPVHCCILWEKQEQAINCPKGDIRLTFCENCGHLFNQGFYEELMTYSQNYDNSLHFSGKFQEYSMALIERLTNTYSIHHKSILEIGCGKGDFLKMICDYGQNKGYGFDKSYQPELETTSKPSSVYFIQDYYSEKYAHYPADVILNRFVLEHIKNPYDFLLNIKNIALNHKNQNKDILFYSEVPNILYTLRDLGIWDLIYEHYSHFTALSLEKLFQKLNLKVINIAENYMGQFLGIEATTNKKYNGNFNNQTDLELIKDFVKNFTTHFQKKRQEWKEKLTQLQKEKKNAVVWGGGAKGVSFLNFLKTKNYINYIVDINPRKKDKYIAGTGQKYIIPEDLKKIMPDVVILMNPIYQEEITKNLTELNLSPEILVA
jgi:SAM-dependent methyltransferase